MLLDILALLPFKASQLVTLLGLCRPFKIMLTDRKIICMSIGKHLLTMAGDSYVFGMVPLVSFLLICARLHRIG